MKTLQRFARAVSEEHIALAGLLLLALAVRVPIARLEHVLQGDEGAYLWLGKTLMSGGGYQFFGRPELHYTPGYPIVSGLVWLVVRDLELASKICFVLFGSLTILPVYYLARYMYGRLSGFVIAGLLAVMPVFTAHVFFWESMSEPLYFFLVFTAVWCAVVAMEHGRWWTYLLCGALFSAAYLTRPEALAYAALTAGYMLVVWLLGRRSLAHLAKIALVPLAFIVAASPYLIFLHRHLGTWSLTGKTWIAFVGHHALVEGDLVAFDRIVWGLDSTGLEVLYHSMEKFTKYSMWREIISNPQEFLMDTLRNVRQLDGLFLSKRVFPSFLLPLVGLGLFRSRWDVRRFRTEVYLFLMALLPALAMAVFTVDLRFYLGTLIILVIWAGHGVVGLGDWLVLTASRLFTGERIGEWVGRLRLATVCLLSIALAGYFLAVYPTMVEEGLGNKLFYYKQVGLWLGEHSRPEERIMSRGAIPAIYAERFWVPFPHADYDEILRYARAHQVEYWVINEREFRLMRPHLAFLADAAQLPAELEWVQGFEGPAGLTVVLRMRE